MTRMKGTLHADLCAFVITSSVILVRMRNVAEKMIIKIQTHVLCSITFFPKILPIMTKCGKIL
jgi:hypothetical protein